MLLLLTLHYDSSLEPDDKPEVASYQKVRHYSAYGKTNRWPMAVFENIVDISLQTVYVLYQIRPRQAVKKSIRRERLKLKLEDNLVTNLPKRSDIMYTHKK